MEVRFVNEEFIKLINFLIVSKESLMVTSDNHFRHFVGLEVTWKRGAGYFDYIFFGLLPSHVTRTCLRKNYTCFAGYFNNNKKNWCYTYF